MSETPLMVFVSSAIDDTKEDRCVARDAIEAFPCFRPWLFEGTPASSELLDESYLSKVRTTDIFVLLVGSVLTPAVRREYEEATKSGRHRLVLVRGESSPEISEFLGTVDVKYSSYNSMEDLPGELQLALNDELIRGYRASYDPRAREVVSEALARKRGIPSPPTAARLSSRSSIGYVAIGIEPGHQVLHPLRIVLGHQASVDSQTLANCDEMIFDDVKEVKQLTECLMQVQQRMHASQPMSARRFLKIWSDEALRRVRPLLATTEAREASRETFGAGILYVKVGWQKDWAAFVKALGVRELTGAPVQELPPAEEFVFDGYDDFVETLNSIKIEIAHAAGDDRRLLQLLVDLGLKRIQNRLLRSFEE